MFENLQAALQCSGFEQMLTELSINVRTNADFPDYWHLDYSQCSPRGNELVNECRGTTVDIVSKRVVAPGLYRFYNDSEAQAASVDWNTATVYEKYDGSLIKLWWSNKYSQWIVSTRGSLAASGSTHTGSSTFAELFWNTIDFDVNKLPKAIIYYFELCTPDNRVVVNYRGEAFAVLLAARNTNESWNEIEPVWIGDPYDIRYADDVPLTKSAVKSVLTELNGADGEGVVVCDANFNRVKIKARSYLHMHYFYSANPVKAWLVTGDADIAEICSYFPEKAVVVEKIELAALLLQAEVDRIIDCDYRVIGMSKLPKVYKSATFAVKRGHKASARDWLKSSSPESINAVFDCFSL